MPPVCARWRLDERDIQAVEQPHVGLDRRRAVGTRAFADVAVRIDEAGHNDLALGIDDGRVRGRFDRFGIADRDDLAVLDDERSLFDRLADDRDYLRVDIRDRLILGIRGDPEQAGRKNTEK